MIDKCAAITFGQITKVNIEKGIVEGIAMDETPDRDGEIFDFATSKPLIEAWSNAAADVTKAAGQDVSYGNVRGQHDRKVAAGTICEPIQFDVTSKSVRVSARVVDKAELEKCAAGVYTGFSVAGRAVKKWRDGKSTRYTVDPVEISLVDIPCNPSAKFEVIKADGIVEVHDFVHKAAESTEAEIAELDGIRRFQDETLQDFVGRAVSGMLQQQGGRRGILKASAMDKVKKAHKALSNMSSCVGGYCDHGSAKGCADAVAGAHDDVMGAFADDGDDDAKEKGAGMKTEETKTPEQIAAEGKTVEKAATPEVKEPTTAELLAKIEALSEKIEKMAVGQPKPVLVRNGTVVTKEGDVEKAATKTPGPDDLMFVRL